MLLSAPKGAERALLGVALVIRNDQRVKNAHGAKHPLNRHDLASVLGNEGKARRAPLPAMHPLPGGLPGHKLNRQSFCCHFPPDGRLRSRGEGSMLVRLASFCCSEFLLLLDADDAPPASCSPKSSSSRYEGMPSSPRTTGTTCLGRATTCSSVIISLARGGTRSRPCSTSTG